MQSPIGRNIKALRKAHRFSLEKLGRMIGSSNTYIWKLENRTPLNPSLEKLAQIAEIFNVSVGYLLEDNLEDQLFDAKRELIANITKSDAETVQKVKQFMKMIA